MDERKSHRFLSFEEKRKFFKNYDAGVYRGKTKKEISEMLNIHIHTFFNLLKNREKTLQKCEEKRQFIQGTTKYFRRSLFPQ